MNAQERDYVDTAIDLAVTKALNAMHEQHKQDCEDVCGVKRLWGAVAAHSKRLRRMEFVLVGGGGLGVIAATAYRLLSGIG